MLPPGSSATADVTFSSGILTFTFGIPAGAPGEVTQAQLSNDLSNTANQAMLNTLPQTSANSNAVALLSGTISNPPTQAEVQENRDKINELVNLLRRTVGARRIQRMAGGDRGARQPVHRRFKPRRRVGPGAAIQ